MNKLVGARQRMFREIFSLTGEPGPKTALEVGVSTNCNLLALKPMVDRAYGIQLGEPSELLCGLNSGTHGISLVSTSSYPFPFPSQSIDFVFATGLSANVALKDLKKICTEVVRIAKHYVACIDMPFDKPSVMQETALEIFFENVPGLSAVGSKRHVQGQDGNEDLNWCLYRKRL